jgi:carbamoyl-phosphate synthase large subunit
MKKVNVLVTGAGGGGIGEQVIKALRIGRNDYFIVATDIRKDSVAICLGDVFCILPPSGSSEYISELIKYCEEYNCQVAIPGSEPELIKIASNIDLFQRAGIFVPINTIDLIRLCSDKMVFNDFLRKNNFAFCDTIRIVSNLIPSNLDNFPYVLKPASGSGSKDVFIVQSYAEIKSILDYLGSENNFLLQEYVGTATEEYTVGILCTPGRGYIKHIILKRDLSLGLSIKQSVLNKSGKSIFGDKLVISTGISQGEFVTNSLIDEAVMKIVKLLSPISTVNLQCRIHENKVYIFEINPRFSGTTNLRAIVGFNEPEYIINERLLILNEELNNECWKNRKVLRGIKEFLIN